jgi:hypothetical protein
MQKAGQLSRKADSRPGFGHTRSYGEPNCRQANLPEGYFQEAIGEAVLSY